MWNFFETRMTPEDFASITCQDLGLRPEFRVRRLLLLVAFALSFLLVVVVDVCCHCSCCCHCAARVVLPPHVCSRPGVVVSE
jgi:hypothetical protein